MMTDEEVICTWMEPRPVGPRTVNRDGWNERADFSECYWWMYTTPRQIATLSPLPAVVNALWMPVPFTLGRLWAVEERLTAEQVCAYECKLGAVKFAHHNDGVPARVFAWHADAPTRIKALAAVLRPEVEPPLAP